MTLSSPLSPLNKIKSLQEYALIKRIKSSHSKSIIIGVSGGLDSTLALLVAINAFKTLKMDLKNIHMILQFLNEEI